MPFVFDKELETSTDIDYQDLIAMKYFKNIREHVILKKFTHLASFDGRHRSGKSITASTIGHLIDPTFWRDYEQRLVQDPKEFVDAVEFIAKQNIRGAVIQVDEAGVSMASSDWYERWLKTISKMVQMFGYLYLIVFFVAPLKDFVDSRIRKMFHSYYKVERFNNEYSIISPYRLKYSSIRNKWYYKSPIVNFQGERIVLNRIRFGKPPQDIIDRYEAIANQRKKEMLAGFIEDMKKDEARETRQELDIDKIINKVVQNYPNYESKRSKPDNPTLEQVKIEFGFRLTNRQAKYVKYEAETMLRNKALEELEREGLNEV